MAHGLEHAVHVLLAVHRDDDDGARGFGHDPPGGLHAVHHRHDQVHQDQVRQLLGATLHRLGAIAGHPHHLVCRLQGDRTA
ncbi:hypothetical protein D3C79_1020160 [compost metagenome]